MKKIFILVFMILILSSCNDNEKTLTCGVGVLEDGKCKVVETMDVSFKCRDGYTYNEETSMCENTITIDAKKVSYCPDGYFIGSDNWCFSDKEYDKVDTIICESDNIEEDDQFSSTYVTDDNRCVEKLCTKVSEDGKSCEEFKETELKVEVKNGCPSGTKNDNGVCRKKYWMTKEYSCELGEKDGKKCIIEDSIKMDSYCEDEDYELSEDGNICEKVTYYEPIVE